MNKLVHRYLGEESLKLYLDYNLSLPYHPYSLVKPIFSKKQVVRVVVDDVDKDVDSLECYLKLKRKPNKCPLICSNTWHQPHYHFFRHLVDCHLDFAVKLPNEILLKVFNTKTKQMYFHDKLVQRKHITINLLM